MPSNDDSTATIRATPGNYGERLARLEQAQHSDRAWLREIAACAKATLETTNRIEGALAAKSAECSAHQDATAKVETRMDTLDKRHIAAIQATNKTLIGAVVSIVVTAVAALIVAWIRGA